MKLKHRALTLLLTVAMLLTFMPAMAFAAPDEDYGDPTAISFTHAGEDDYTVEGDLRYEEYNEATQEWESCDPYVYYYVPDFVEGDTISVTYENTASIKYTYTKVYESEDPDDYYWGWVADDNEAPGLTPEMEWERSQSSKGIHFKAGDTEYFRVYISYYADEEHKIYSTPLTATLTYDETKDYESKYVNNDDASVTYDAGGRKLTVDFTKEYGSEEYCNFPKDGDKITVTEKGKTAKVYTYDTTRGEENYFVSEDGEELSFGWNAEYGVLDVWAESKTVDTEKKLNIYTSYYSRIDATIITDVESMKYEPSSVSVYSENIKFVDEGKTYYDFDRRYTYKDEEGDTYHSCYANGDKLTVKFKGSIGTKVFIAKNGCLVNVKDPEDEIYVNTEAYLEPGNNTVKFWYHGRYASINVYMDTPALREARAKAARDAASNINKSTVSASDIKKASDLGATSVTFGASVKKIQKNAFKGTNITYVELKTKKLKAKSVKGSLKGSKVRTIKVNIGKKKVNKQYVKKYKKIFTKKNAGKKVKVK